VNKDQLQLKIDEEGVVSLRDGPRTWTIFEICEIATALYGENKLIYILPKEEIFNRTALASLYTAFELTDDDQQLKLQPNDKALTNSTETLENSWRNNGPIWK
jgi:hypothetical protein